MQVSLSIFLQAVIATITFTFIVHNIYTRECSEALFDYAEANKQHSVRQGGGSLDMLEKKTCRSWTLLPLKQINFHSNPNKCASLPFNIAKISPICCLKMGRTEGSGASGLHQWLRGHTCQRPYLDRPISAPPVLEAVVAQVDWKCRTVPVLSCTRDPSSIMGNWGDSDWLVGSSCYLSLITHCL